MGPPGPEHSTGSRPVVIHYRRPPDRVRDFHQMVVEERDDVVVTLASEMSWPEPLVVDGRVVLETGSSVVWFTFPGVWHDIGRFHRADGTPTGIYANVLTPVELSEKPPGWGRSGETEATPWVWDTTDLFLDLWLPAGEGTDVQVLDEDELDDALARGWVPRKMAERAREEAGRLAQAARAGRWPPPVVEAWTLSRAEAASDQSSSGSST